MMNSFTKVFVLLLSAACFSQCAVGAQATHRVWNTENGLPQNSVHAIVQASDGFLWVATEKGIARFDGVEFLNYSHENTAEFTDDDVRSLTANNDGSLLVFTPEKTFRFREGRFSEISHSAFPVVRPSQESPNKVWINGGDEVNRRTEPGSISRWKLPATQHVNRIQTTLLDSQGVVWVGTRHGLFRIEHEKLVPVEELAGDSVLSLLQDREGSIWVGTSTTGLHLLAPRPIEVVTSFSNHGITTVAQTADKSLWAGTADEGLLHSRPDSRDAAFLLRGLNSDVVLSLSPEANGELLVGSTDGLHRVKGGKVLSSLRSSDGLPDDLVRSILQDSDGSIWIGTRRGLAHWTSFRTAILNQGTGLPSDLVGALLRTSSGDLWIGTLHGVALLKKGHLTSFPPDEAVTSLLEDRSGRLWLGGASSGLHLWDGSVFRRVAAGGMPLHIFGIIDDDQGYLWIRTHSGLGRINSKQAQVCALESRCDLSVRLFNTSDGLPSNDIFEQGHPGQIRAEDGTLYFATRRGLVKVTPSAIQQNLVAPQPAITKVSVDNHDHLVGAGTEIVLRPNERRITFSYIAPAFRQPGEIRYRYKLEGFDRDWIDGGAGRSVSYTNLSPGHHRFLLMAKNEDGVWSSRPAQLNLAVQPAFFRRWWFYVLCLAATACLIYLFYWLRERRLKQSFNAVLSERNRIAREIHDTLAQDLAGVSVQLEVVSSLMHNQQSEAAAGQLEQVKATVRDGLRSARQSIWDLRVNDDDHTLPVRAKRAAEQIAGAQCPVRFEVVGSYRPLATQAEEEILNIMKEAVRNAVRHAQASHIAVAFQYQPHELLMTVKDNGCGFDMNVATPGHFGLRGMQERADSIKAAFNVKSISGEGTCVRLVSTYRQER